MVLVLRFLFLTSMYVPSSISISFALYTIWAGHTSIMKIVKGR